MYEDVLLAVDGSQENDHVVEQALGVAEATGATLHVVHVVDQSAAAVEASEHPQRLLDALEAAGRETVDEVVDRARERDLTVKASVLAGVPHRAVLDYADEREADPVALGTRGRTDEEGIIGSVAGHVVRNAEIPVLAVPGADGR